MSISYIRQCMRGKFDKEVQDKVVKYINNKGKKPVKVKFIDSTKVDQRVIDSVCSRRVFKVKDKSGSIVQELFDERVTVFNSDIELGIYKDESVYGSDLGGSVYMTRPTYNNDNIVIVKDVVTSNMNYFGHSSVEVYIVV